MPLVTLDIHTCQKLAFGQCIEVLGIDEKLAASVEVETAGGRDGKQSSLDGTSSSDNVYSQCNSAEMYLGGGDTKCSVDTMNSIGSHMDMLSGHWDVPSVKTNTIMPANAPEIVRMPRKKNNPPNSPIETAMQPSDGLNGIRDHTDGLSTQQTYLLEVQLVACRPDERLREPHGCA